MIPITFLVNPAAQAGQAAKKWERMTPQIKQLFPHYQVRFTENPGDAMVLAKNCAESAEGIVVAVGGDGTINETANGLLKAKRPGSSLALLPLGTGGDYARTLKISHNSTRALQQLKVGRKAEVDVGLATFRDFSDTQQTRFFVNLLSFGLGGMTSYLVNNRPKILGGRVSFFLGACQAIYSYKPREILVTTRLDNGEQCVLFQGPVHLMTIAKGNYCGGGMYMTPQAQPVDGLLHIVLVPETSRMRLLWNLPKIYFGKHLSDPKVNFFACSQVEIRCQDKDMLADLDGESPGFLPASAECISRRLSVIVGEDF